MTGYSGWGRLSTLLMVVPFALFFYVVDHTGGDWHTALPFAAVGSVLAGALNLAVAAGLNRGDPDGPDQGWLGTHRFGGTAMQSHTPIFLAFTGLALACWLAPWVSWPGAAAIYVAGTLAYYQLPRLRRRPLRAATIGRRRAFAERHGLRFRETLPELAGRWNFAPFAPEVSLAAQLNRPTMRLREHFAGMGGTHDGYPFTVVDAFTGEPWAVLPRWSWYPVTVCVIHLDVSLPGLRVVRARSRRRGKQADFEYDCLMPEFAELAVNERVLAEMIEQDLNKFEIHGRDVLVILAGMDDQDDPDDEAVAFVGALAAVTSQIDADLTRWDTGTLAPLPVTDQTSRT